LVFNHCFLFFFILLFLEIDMLLFRVTFTLFEFFKLAKGILIHIFFTFLNFCSSFWWTVFLGKSSICSSSFWIWYFFQQIFTLFFSSVCSCFIKSFSSINMNLCLGSSSFINSCISLLIISNSISINLFQSWFNFLRCQTSYTINMILLCFSFSNDTSNKGLLICLKCCCISIVDLCLSCFFLVSTEVFWFLLSKSCFWFE